MNINKSDINRLAHEVRRFLNKGDAIARLAGMATLYLEFPDVGTMHHFHQGILLAIMEHSENGSYEYIDDHTIKLEPIMGVVIVLSSKQRFAVPMGGSVGYRDIAFNAIKVDDDHD